MLEPTPHSPTTSARPPPASPANATTQKSPTGSKACPQNNLGAPGLDFETWDPSALNKSNYLAFSHRLPQLHAVPLWIPKPPKPPVTLILPLLIDPRPCSREPLHHPVQRIHPEIHHGPLIALAKVLRILRKKRKYCRPCALRPFERRIPAT